MPPVGTHKDNTAARVRKEAGPPQSPCERLGFSFLFLSETRHQVLLCRRKSWNPQKQISTYRKLQPSAFCKRHLLVPSIDFHVFCFFPAGFKEGPNLTVNNAYSMCIQHPAGCDRHGALGICLSCSSQRVLENHCTFPQSGQEC